MSSTSNSNTTTTEMNTTSTPKETVPKKRKTAAPKKDKKVADNVSANADAITEKVETPVTTTKETTVPKKRKTAAAKKDKKDIVIEVTSKPDTNEPSSNEIHLNINDNNDNMNTNTITNVIYHSDDDSDLDDFGSQPQEEQKEQKEQKEHEEQEEEQEQELPPEKFSEEESFRRLKEHVKSQDKIKAQMKAQLEAQMREKLKKAVAAAASKGQDPEKTAQTFKNGIMNNDESNQYIIMTTIMKFMANLVKYADCNCQDEDAHEDCTYDYNKQIEEIKSLFMYLTTIPKFIKQYPELIDKTMMKIQRFRQKEKDNVVLKETYIYYDMFIKNLKEEMKRDKEQKEKEQKDKA